MPTEVRFRRGTTAQNDAFTGGQGELSVDTQKKTVRVHDGLTQGGNELVNTSSSQEISNKTIGSDLLPSADSAYDLGSPSAKWKSLYLSGNTLFLGNIVLKDSGGSLSVIDSDGASVPVSLASNTTDNLVEGSNNLYYTKARVDSDVTQGINALIDGAPDALDTLNELAAALNDDSNFAGTVTASLATKVSIANFDTYFDSALGAKTTDDLAEGSDLYYTRDRFDSALGDTTSISAIRGYFSAAGDLSYNSSTGEFSFDVENVYTKSNFDSDFNVALDEAALGGTGLTFDSATNTLNITNTGVVAGNYGSATLVPVISVNNQGQIDSIGEVVVDAITSVDFDSANGTFSINTANGQTFSDVITLDPYSTSDLAEGSNLYYTRDRFDSALGDATSTATIRSYFSASGDISYNSGNGTFTVDTYKDSDFDARLATKTTDNLTEGSNLYYTTARADSDAKNAVSAGTGLSYSAATGVFSVPSSGVVAGTYGSSTAVPQITVDAQGFVDSISEVTIAGVTGVDFDSANGTITVQTTGGNFSDVITLDPYTTDNLAEGSNLYYTTARADSAFDDRLATKTTDNLAEGSNLYYTTARADSAFDDRLATKSTDDLAEGSNLYYTTARADSAFDDRLATKSTDDLAEGTNLYYTTLRADSAFDDRLATKTTDNLAEGSNLYYTTNRADSDARYAVSVTDAGGDGSLSYAAATGVFTYTGPSAAEARAHFSGGTGVTITDGVVAIGQAVGTTDSVQFGYLETSGNVVIGGNLQVNGTQTIINTTNLSVEDNMFYLNQLESDGSPTISVDIGFAGNYNDIGSYAHTGFFRDASDGVWKLFQGYTPEPDSSAEINVAHGSFEFAAFQASTLTGKYLGFDSDFGDQTTDDLTEGSNLYYTTARADSAFDDRLATKSTNDLTEGSNLYYTTARADSDFDDRLATKTTSNLAEGSNLYYTTARADSDFDARLATKTTDNVTEGSTNKYFSNTLARSAFSVSGDLTYDSATGVFGVTVPEGYTTADFDSDFAAQTTFSGTSSSVNVTANNSTNETTYLTFVDGATGSQGIETDTGLTYNPSTGVLTSTTFSGALSGNASTATTATNVTATANNSTNETTYITFVDGTTGDQGIETDTGLTYNPSTQVLTTTTFSGALSGNASTASSWQTSRTLTLGTDLTGNVSFNGSANFTLNANIANNVVDAAALNVDSNGTVGHYLVSDGDGSFSWAAVQADPTMGGDLTGTASNAQIAANVVGASELNVDGNGTSGQALLSDGDGSMSWGSTSDEYARTIALLGY